MLISPRVRQIIMVRSALNIGPMYGNSMVQPAIKPKIRPKGTPISVKDVM